MEYVTQKMVILDDIELSLITTILLADIMKNKQYEILNAIGAKKIDEFEDKLNRIDYSKMTNKEQSERVIALLNNLLLNQGIL